MLLLDLPSLTVTPYQAIGIPIALAGAVFLAVGAQFQSRGVGKVRRSATSTESGGVGFRQLTRLLKRPSWVIGTLMLGFAIVLQLVSLGFAPLIVVQPLGVVALIVTAVINSRITRARIDTRSRVAIALCVAGVAAFVVCAATVGNEAPVNDAQLLIVVSILAGVSVVLIAAFFIVHKRGSAIFYIVAAGVLFGFVASLAKITINRVVTGNFDELTIVSICGLLAAAVLGTYFVQNAHVHGPPDLVIAGLTVIDPLVAVGIGILVLHEAAGAPAYAFAIFIVAALAATGGVWQLAKYHPEMIEGKAR